MKIAMGCDHAGFVYKKEIIEHLTAGGHTITDVGCYTTDSCDYPDSAAAVARAVVSGAVERGILMCGSGVGMSIAANKFPGIRAGMCWSETIAQLIAEHNAANVICLGSRFATASQMILWIDRWLATPLAVAVRHQKRIDKKTALEITCEPK